MEDTGEPYSGQMHSEAIAHGAFAAVMLLLTAAMFMIDDSLCISTARHCKPFLSTSCICNKPEIFSCTIYCLNSILVIWG